MQRFGGEDLLCGACFTSPERCGRSCWTRGNKLPRFSLKQSALICRNSWSIAPNSGPRWMCATRNVVDAAPIMNYFHSAASIAHKEAMAKTKGKRLPRSAKEPHRLSRVLIPRSARTSHVRGATANFRSSTPLRDRSCVAVDGVSAEHRVH